MDAGRYSPGVFYAPGLFLLFHHLHLVNNIHFPLLKESVFFNRKGRGVNKRRDYDEISIYVSRGGEEASYGARLPGRCPKLMLIQP